LVIDDSPSKVGLQHQRDSMTDDMMNLRAPAEKAPDPDLLRDMIGFAA
jgi:hypothetical protein